MATASSESRSRTPSATVSGGSSSRISSRTVSSTSVSAVKSKSAPISAIRRGRNSGSSASRTRADIGLMQIADELAQRRRVAGVERLDDLLDIVRAQGSVRVARRNGGQRHGHVFVVEHAGPSD